MATIKNTEIKLSEATLEQVKGGGRVFPKVEIKSAATGSKHSDR